MVGKSEIAQKVSMPAQWIDIRVGNDSMETYIAYPPDDAKHPAVIVAQEIWGVNAYIQSITNRLAREGYVAIAPALFHREGPGTIGLFEETDIAFERLGRLRDDQLLEDLRAVESFLQDQSNVVRDSIGIVGFCVGGRISYLAAANLEHLSAAVDFYGGRCFVPFGESPTPFDQTQDIRVPLLGLFGEDDQNPSPEDVARMREELERCAKDFEFHSYAGAGHGFNCEERPTYRREASLDAWARTLDWFERYLAH